MTAMLAGLTAVAAVVAATALATVLRAAARPGERQAARALRRTLREQHLTGAPPSVRGTLFAASSVDPALYLMLLGRPAIYTTPPRELGPFESADVARPVVLVDPVRDGGLTTTVTSLRHPPGAEALRRLDALRAAPDAARERWREDPEVLRCAASLAGRGAACDVVDGYLEGYAVARTELASDAPSPEPQVDPLWYEVLAGLMLPARREVAVAIAAGYFHGRTGTPSAAVTLGTRLR